MGMAVRCIGHGMKVGIVQFVKVRGNRRAPGAGAVPRSLCDTGDGGGFTWDTQDLKRDMAAARRRSIRRRK